jgi:hypothetical protein
MKTLDFEIYLTKDNIYQILTYSEQLNGYFDAIGTGFETLPEAMQHIDEMITTENPEFIKIKIYKQ